MGPYNVKTHTGDTCHPENRVRKTNWFTRILDANMGPYSVKTQRVTRVTPKTV